MSAQNPIRTVESFPEGQEPAYIGNGFVRKFGLLYLIAENGKKPN